MVNHYTQIVQANIQKVKREQDQRSEYNQEEIQILQVKLTLPIILMYEILMLVSSKHLVIKKL